MKNTIITISRQYGSGGRELAQILAKKLNVKLYDRQIVHLAAAQLGLSGFDEKELKNLADRTPAMSSKFMPFYIFGTNGTKPMSQQMFDHESEVIRHLADEGPCVILGRCADAVLKDNPKVCSVYVCADDEYRTKRGREVYDGKTLAELNKEDAKRAEYYHYYTGRTWGNAANYHLTVNTSFKPLTDIADVIIDYINK